MKRRFALGLMLAALIPAGLMAQSSGEVVLKDAAQQGEALPVTLDFSLPAESQWLAKINANPTLSPYSPASSKAQAALGASVTSADASGEVPQADVGQSPPSAAHAALCCCGDNGGGPHVASNGLITPTEFGLPDRIVSRFFGPTGRIREWLRNFEPQVFHRGAMYVEWGTQYWRSPIYVTSIFDTTMLPQMVRFGYMLNDPCADRRFLKGVFSAIAEFDYIPILTGAGTYMVGGSGLLRYHAARNHRIVPYFQIGFGGLSTDSAGAVNSPTTTNFNFITQFAAGSHIFIGQSGKWAIMNESSYTFIHNWGIGQGPGYHVLGGLVGITRFFGRNNNGCDNCN